MKRPSGSMGATLSAMTGMAVEAAVVLAPFVGVSLAGVGVVAGAFAVVSLAAVSLASARLISCTSPWFGVLRLGRSSICVPGVARVVALGWGSRRRCVQGGVSASSEPPTGPGSPPMPDAGSLVRIGVPTVFPAVAATLPSATRSECRLSSIRPSSRGPSVRSGALPEARSTVGGYAPHSSAVKPQNTTSCGIPQSGTTISGTGASCDRGGRQRRWTGGG